MTPSAQAEFLDSRFRLQHLGRPLPPDHRDRRAAVLDLGSPGDVADPPSCPDCLLGSRHLPVRPPADYIAGVTGHLLCLRVELGLPNSRRLPSPRGRLGRPILALAIDALDRADDKQLLIFAGLLLLVREDMGILVVLLGILRLFNRRRRWLGFILVAAGVIVYELATAVILPHFSPDQHFAYWQYGPTLGPNLGSALGHVVLHPLDTARLFFSPMIKTQTLLLFLVPVLFLALRSRYSILALPCWRSGSSNPRYGTTSGTPAFTTTRCPGSSSCSR